MKRKLLLLTAGVALLWLSESAIAQQKPKTLKKPASKAVQKPSVAALIPNDPAVKIGKLPNGLTYYIRKNTEPKKRASLYLVNNIGSLMENDDQQGLAHFLEHMAFNGTQDFPKNEIINYLQKAGVRFGADLNAYTNYNQTVYQLPIPTDSTEVFKTGFKILANWAGKISLNGSDIDSERGVIIEEERQTGKNARARMGKRMDSVIYANSRYLNRKTIGTIDILQNFTHDKIRSFYTDWYRPNLQAVIAVGDFDVNEVEKLIKANFSELTNPANPKPRLNYSLSDNVEPLVKVITDKEHPYNAAVVMYKHHEKPLQSNADFRRTIKISIINNMLGARLQEILQSGTAPFFHVQSAYDPAGLARGTGVMKTMVVSKTGAELGKALSVALAENERMARFGFTRNEFETAKKNIEAGNETQYKEKDKTESASYVNQYLNHFLIGTAIPSADYIYNESKEILKTLTLAEVNALAKSLITKKNQLVVVQAQEKEAKALPTEAQLLTILKNSGEHVKPYIDKVVNKPLLAAIPTPGKIVSESKNDKIGISTLTLSNGVKVVLKPTDFKNDEVQFYSFAKGGSSLAKDDDFQSADNASLVTRNGVGEFNPTQLTKYLAGKNVGADVYIDTEYQGFSGYSVPKDLEMAFQLIYAYATHPRKDATLFNKKISDIKALQANKNSSPPNVFADTVQAVLANYHKRGMPIDISDIDKISLDKAFAFYKDRFADASGQTFVFVGNFDAEKIKPLIATYLASLPALNRNENFVDLGINPPKGKVSKTIYKGLEDKATVGLYFHGDYDYNADNNIQLEALKEALTIKIQQRLREKESGVYSPGVGISLQKYPSAHYYFVITFNCATANVEKLINAALEEVNSLSQNGATEEDLKKFKSEELRQQELALRDNGFWLNYLANRLKYGDNVEQLLGNKDRISGVTPESTKAVAQKYLNGDNYIRIVMLPEKK